MREVYRFKSSGNLYEVTQRALMKNPETRNWDNCIIYRSFKLLEKDGNYVEIPEEERLTFVREEIEFYAKFEKEN
jgi:hypothetical protein